MSKKKAKGELWITGAVLGVSGPVPSEDNDRGKPGKVQRKSGMLRGKAGKATGNRSKRRS